MLTKVYGSAVFGVEATTIIVEVNSDKGIGYHLVGLQDNAIKESNYRIAAALQNNGYKIPEKKLPLIWRLRIFVKKFLLMTSR
jgi:magnesium chelatase family protein